MNASNATDPFGNMEFTFRVMRMALYPLVLGTGIVGNILVALVIVLGRPRDLKPSVRYFILNLAISDLIVLVMFIPFDLAYMEMGIWIFGEAMCKVVNTLNYAFVTVSGTTLAAISIDRHRSIVYPIKKCLSIRMTKVIIVIIWIYAILTLVPFIDSLHVTPNGYCANDMKWWPTLVAFQINFVLSCLVPGCILPLTCIALCYVSIGNSMNQQNNGHKGHKGLPHIGHGLSHRTKRNRKTIKVLTSLVAAYTISTLPHYIILSMAVFDSVDTDALPYIYEAHEFTRLLVTANCCLNPIMYSAVSKEFRDRMKYICCRTRFLVRGHDVNPAAGPFPAVRLKNLPSHQQL